jgi:hypothetical protein
MITGQNRMMTTRERFHAIVNFNPFDRLPIVEWAGWWDETIDRWHQEDLPTELTDRYDICRHFGLDLYKQIRLVPRAPTCPRPALHGGAILSSLAEYETIRAHLYPLPAVDHEILGEWATEQARGEAVIWFTVDGFFWFPRTLLGIEPHLYAFYDQPELMHRINTDLCEWILAVIDEICSICTPDFMTFAEDLSYNHGPMLSREHFQEYLTPYYAEVIPDLKRRGIVPIIDSDGDVSIPAYWFEDAEIEGILPLERQAGVDIAVLRNDHPSMRFIGHFDKMVMNRGEAAMRAEFERLLPTAAQGGYIISCDHQTPPGVSYQDYRTYLALFAEYAAEAGGLSKRRLSPQSI